MTSTTTNLLLALLLLLTTPHGTSSLSIVPKPRNQTTDHNITLTTVQNLTFSATNQSSPLLQKAFERYATLIRRNQRGLSSESLADQRSLDWLLSSSLLSQQEYDDLTARVPSSSTTSPITSSSTEVVTGVDVSVSSTVQIKTLDTDESYILSVDAPRIQITANTVYGAIYALESLSQLLDAKNNCIQKTIIMDTPRFSFRATMIDTARHWYPIPIILQHLDAMSSVKMNVLHWHIVSVSKILFCL